MFIVPLIQLPLARWQLTISLKHPLDDKLISIKENQKIDVLSPHLRTSNKQEISQIIHEIWAPEWIQRHWKGLCSLSSDLKITASIREYFYNKLNHFNRTITISKKGTFFYKLSSVTKFIHANIAKPFHKCLNSLVKPNTYTNSATTKSSETK